MISFDALITPVTEEQFLERFLTNLETVGLRARSWRPAGVYRTILRVLAGTCASFSDLQVQFIRSGFLELARGNWLTWVAYYVYGVERPDASFATGRVTATNGGGGDYAFTPGQLRIFNTTTKKAYTNVGTVLLHPLGTATFDVVAVELGADSSSAAGAIDGVETQYQGQIQVTNGEPVIGSDAMLDPDLQQLCKDNVIGRSVFGPRGAYAAAVRSAKRTNGTAVDINRVSISPSSSTGQVTIIVASPSGVPIADDLTAVRNNVEAKARCDTATALTSGATAVTITRTLTIWARKQTGLSASDVRALAQKQIVMLQREYPIGGMRKNGAQGYFWADSLDGAVQKAHPSIFSVDGLGADVAMSAAAIPTLAVTIGEVRIVDTEVH